MKWPTDSLIIIDTENIYMHVTIDINIMQIICAASADTSHLIYVHARNRVSCASTSSNSAGVPCDARTPNSVNYRRAVSVTDSRCRFFYRVYIIFGNRAYSVNVLCLYTITTTGARLRVGISQ